MIFSVKYPPGKYSVKLILSVKYLPSKTSFFAELALNLNLHFFPVKNWNYDVIWQMTLESVGSWKQLQVAKRSQNIVLVYVDPIFPFSCFNFPSKQSLISWWIFVKMTFFCRKERFQEVKPQFSKPALLVCQKEAKLKLVGEQ